MCHVKHIDYPCKHLKCTLWKTCEDFGKLPQSDREAMCRAAVLRCPRAGGKTEEITIHSGIRADVGAKIDRATRAVNRKLPFGIALPSAGCERCHKGHELSKLILAEKINKIEKLVAIVEDMEEATAAEDRGEPAADSGRKGQDQSAKHLLELLRAQSVTGVMLVHGPFVPVTYTTLLLGGLAPSAGAKGQSSSSGAA